MDPVKLGREIARQLLIESEGHSPVVVYAGRFSPFHLGHFDVYQKLVGRFGKNNVYIATSNVSNSNESPFSFDEKKHIITSMFPISSDHVVNVKDPYRPIEILSKFPADTPYVAAVGEKDSSRLGSNPNGYFQKYSTSIQLSGYKDKGYVIQFPQLPLIVDGKTISGTQIRNIFRDKNVNDSHKKEIFTKIYGKFNPNVFKIITDKLSNVNEESTNTQEQPVKKLINPKSAHGRSTNILYKKIRNPDNNRKIYVKTALGYNDDHPVKKTALQMMSRNESVEFSNGRMLLTCGGNFGHMQHPFEDFDLSFGDIKQMIDLGLSGKLDIEEPVREKTDGQNISVSWKNGKTIFARNKSQIKDFGANGLGVSGISQMFAGRGSLSDAFTFAAKDLDSAISGLSNAQKNKIFNEGQKFMSVEIIYPDTTNVIPYGLDLLVFHGTLATDKEGNTVKYDGGDARILAGMIKQINANVQKNFEIQGPPIVTLPKSKNFESSKAKYFSMLSKTQSKYGLNDTDHISDLVSDAWHQKILDTASKFQYPITNNVLIPLIDRWAFGNKDFSINRMKSEIDNKKFLDWILSVDQESSDFNKTIVEPVETLFLQLGAEILSNISDVLSVNPDAAVSKISSDLKQVSDEMENSTDIKKIAKFKQQLQKLSSLGNKIFPLEGIVFVFHGKTYKMTSTFSQIGQILGLLRY